MSGWVYILECADKSYYTGSTNNLECRLAQHQNGEGANYTKKHLPVKLVFSQEYERVVDAFYAEKQVQGWSRKKKEALINGDFEKLPELARCLNESHFSNKPASPFDSAQGTPSDSAQGPVTSVLNLNSGDAAGIESKAIKHKVKKRSLSGERRRSLSGVEGHDERGINLKKNNEK